MKSSTNVSSWRLQIGRLIFLLLAVFCLNAHGFGDQPDVIVVVGAGGAAEYEQAFSEWAKRIGDTCQRAKIPHRIIGLDQSEEATDRQQTVDQITKAAKGTEPLWIIFLGHGTSFQETTKFNLRGPDLSAKDLAAVIKQVERPTISIVCASSSAPFLKALSGPNRVVMTATKSGSEQNFSRFGDYFSSAIADASADLDHDDQVSVLEAFLIASKSVQRFYESESRIATETALIEDNGDGLGTSSDFFDGVRIVAKAQNGTTDGKMAHQFVLIKNDRELLFSVEMLTARTQIEKEIDKLRSEKDRYTPDEYFARLEPLMIRLANLYRQVESASAEKDPDVSPAEPETPSNDDNLQQEESPASTPSPAPKSDD